MQVSKRYIKYLVLLAPFLFSAVVYTQISSFVANILLIGKMIAFLYVLINYLKKRRLSVFDIAILAYFSIWFYSVYLNGASFIEYVKEVVVIISFVFIIEDALKKNEGEYLISAFQCLMFVELAINLICLILFPDGLWRTYSIYGDEAIYSFLGLDNQTTPIFIVAELIIFIKLYYNDFIFSIYTKIYIAVLIGNLLLTGSATGIMGCVIVPLLFIMGIHFSKIVNIKTVFITIVGIFILIVLLRLQNIFAFIIEGIFNKDLTLTNRIGIWDKAIEMIKQKPILGYGCGTLDAIIGDRHAHDFYLQIILQTGILGASVYINIFRIALKNCWKEKNAIYSLIFAAVFLGYMICGISEVYSQSWLFIILSLGYTLPIVSKNYSSM